ELRTLGGELFREESRVVRDDDAVPLLARFLEVVGDSLRGESHVFEGEVLADDPAPTRSSELDHGSLPGVRTLAHTRCSAAAPGGARRRGHPATFPSGSLCAIIRSRVMGERPVLLIADDNEDVVMMLKMYVLP